MIIGTRGSELALKQTSIAIGKLKLIDYKIRTIKTKGDKIKQPLQKIGANIFTKELDRALLNNKIDLAVHSLKDIPVEDFNPKLEIAVIVERADPRDCLIGNIFSNAVVGTDSIRRQYELKNYYKNLNLNFKPIRGNIATRIKKLKNNEYNAIVIAKTALNRLKLNKNIDKIFQIKRFVPAAGQGAIAIVKRKKEKLRFKKDKLYDCCMLEREFIKGLGGCKKPVGAYCKYNKGFNLIGLVYKNNKRILVNFSGNKEKILKEIRKFKAK